MTCPWIENSGSCERVLLPRKSLLSVYSVTAALPSSVQRSMALDRPSSGLNDQRWVPMLSSRAASYCDEGTVTCKLAPKIRSCWYFANSLSVSAGAP